MTFQLNRIQRTPVMPIRLLRRQCLGLPLIARLGEQRALDVIDDLSMDLLSRKVGWRTIEGWDSCMHSFCRSSLPADFFAGEGLILSVCSAHGGALECPIFQVAFSVLRAHRR